MIKCCITSTDFSESRPGPGGLSARNFLRLAVLPHTEHVTIVDDPKVADLIIFAETNHDDLDRTDLVSRLKSHKLVQQYAHKCCVHSGKDLPRLCLPGMYPSVGSWATRFGFVGGPYLCSINPHVRVSNDFNPDHLASFSGVCRGKPVRMKLAAISRTADWSRFDVLDTSEMFLSSLRRGDGRLHNQLKLDYVHQILNAKFSLCPKGFGRSCYRIFESMACGRSPIIISDGWSAPPKVDWEAFSTMIPERDVHRIPDLLEVLEPEWESRGRLAHEAWMRNFCPDAQGRYVVECMADAVSVFRSTSRPQSLAKDIAVWSNNGIGRSIGRVQARISARLC